MNEEVDDMGLCRWIEHEGEGVDEGSGDRDRPPGQFSVGLRERPCKWEARVGWADQVVWRR